MVDEPVDAARHRRVCRGDVLHGDSRPPSLVVDVRLEHSEWPLGYPAPPRRPFAVPPLVGVPDPLEPLEHNRFVVRHLAFSTIRVETLWRACFTRSFSL